MSDEAAPAPAKKKGGKKKLILMLAGGLLLVGGGAGAGMYAAGTGLAGGKHGEEVDPNQPQLVKREGAEEHAAPPSAAKGHDAKPDMSQYKATYYTMDQSFTSNLQDSDGFAQIGLGVATYYDQRVIDNVKDNEMPIRSAILMVLANQEAMVLSTPGGKAALQEELAKVVNEVLEQKTGFGGVDSVYFTSFIIQ